jgi:hypothetical protein
VTASDFAIAQTFCSAVGELLALQLSRNAFHAS